MEGMAMKKEQKIVVAVDESDESMYALSWCLSNLVAQNSNSTIVLLYVKPPPLVYTAYNSAGLMFSRDLIAAMEKHGNDLVNSVMRRAEVVYRNFDSHINVEKMVGSGEAKDVICTAVNKLRADTLVMGSHGYGFLKRVLLGSVSEHCAKFANCPVVIVKKEK